MKLSIVRGAINFESKLWDARQDVMNKTFATESIDVQIHYGDGNQDVFDYSLDRSKSRISSSRPRIQKVTTQFDELGCEFSQINHGQIQLRDSQLHLP